MTPPPIDRTNWRESALCARPNMSDIFFPEVGETGQAARAICARCPVTDWCLAEAQANREQHGIWGGTDYRERRKMRRQTGGGSVKTTWETAPIEATNRARFDYGPDKWEALDTAEQNERIALYLPAMWERAAKADRERAKSQKRPQEVS